MQVTRNMIRLQVKSIAIFYDYGRVLTREGQVSKLILGGRWYKLKEKQVFPALSFPTYRSAWEAVLGFIQLYYYR